jgi:hypothetical protein
MGDRKSLSIIGLTMSMVTVAVVLVGVFVVQGNLSGRYVLERTIASQPF